MPYQAPPTHVAGVVSCVTPALIQPKQVSDAANPDVTGIQSPNQWRAHTRTAVYKPALGDPHFEVVPVGRVHVHTESCALWWTKDCSIAICASPCTAPLVMLLGS